MTKDEIQNQIAARLHGIEAAANTGRPDVGVAKEGALLNALVTMQLTNGITESTKALTDAIDRFTTSTDRAGRGMFWLTVMLTEATLAQAIVAILSLTK